MRHDQTGGISAATTQAYLHLLDTQRIYREAYEGVIPPVGVVDEEL